MTRKQLLFRLLISRAMKQQISIALNHFITAALGKCIKHKLNFFFSLCLCNLYHILISLTFNLFFPHLFLFMFFLCLLLPAVSFFSLAEAIEVLSSRLTYQVYKMNPLFFTMTSLYYVGKMKH